MLLIMQWSVGHGFLGYVNRLEEDRLEDLAEKLGSAYAEHHNWNFLRDDPEKMYQFIAETMYEIAPQVSRLPAPESGDKWANQRPLGSFGLRYKCYHLGKRIFLLDSKHRPIFGTGTASEINNFKTITYEGRVVGYVGFRPRKYLSDVHQLHFLKQQKLILIITACIMLVVAVGLSLPLARHLVRPLKNLADATYLLASGRYDIRVPDNSTDELGQLSKDFNLMAETLKKNEQARRQFVADISHELRTPLAVLRGEIEALQDGVRQPTVEAIGSLHSEVIRLGRLVDDLYQLALSDVGALVYKKTKIDLSKVLVEAVDRVRPEIIKKSIAMTVNLPRSKMWLVADHERLSQLFDNVLENAKRYTDPGGQVKINLGHGHGWAIVDIMDSIPGVPASEIGKLFDRLYRVESSRSRASGGAGLGLAICKKIVEDHGGRIEAHPSPLGGLWIKILLPLTGYPGEDREQDQ
ncbi:ATP-binding protein [Dissulfurimicrobium hydrothermale]|uniref:ATP-binding protein n=1 Tax=Dissulfurimicrobium hydrothermale TaxID=1750598 RepID=UPI001EDA37DF|nr:ATP-binding protein [Dissulfurimicrobium hydrothermale]UKL13408.1 HAMP domain-containing protein [Dissulfurimicrobium hydrothermale]